MGLDDAVRLADYEPLDWGAQGEGYGTWNPDRNTNQSFVHWGGTSVSPGAVKGDIRAEMSQLRSWESYHMRNGWRLLAYDFAVGNSGKIYLARGYSRSGAQAGDIDLDGTSNNDEAEGVVVIVGKGQKASQKALNSLARLLEILGYDEVYGHRESAQRGSGTATECPGDQLMEFVQNYRGGSFAPSDGSQHGHGGSKMFVRKGDRGQAVVYLQALLKNLGEKIKADGIYGPKTVEAFKKYVGSDGTYAGPWQILTLQKRVAQRVNKNKASHGYVRTYVSENAGGEHTHEARVVLE